MRKESPMASKVKEFVNEQAQVLAEQAARLRQAPGKVVRGAAAKSAKGIRALHCSLKSSRRRCRTPRHNSNALRNRKT